MAKKKKEKAEPKDSEKLRAVHERAIKRFYRSEEADRIQAELAQYDLVFKCGDQWEAREKITRKANGQPCLTLNMMPEKISQVVGDQRQNKPEIKVRPVDDFADPETAEVQNGLIRAIMANSSSNLIINTAFESQVSCGRGAFRLVTEYETEKSFDQVIKLKWISNVFSVKWDPGAQQYDKQDGKYFFIYNDMQKKDYEEEYPEASKEGLPYVYNYANNNYMSTCLVGWTTEDTIRIAEYFERVDTLVEIVLLESGVTIESSELEEGMKVKTRPDGTEYRRIAEIRKILWYKINGSQILEGPKEFPSSFYPIVMAWGKEDNINGKRFVRGMVRDGMDAQRQINVWESKTVETLCMMPTAPFHGTKKQFEGHESLYEAAAKGEMVFMLLYNHDDDAKESKPTRITPPMIPTGMENRAAVNKDNLKDTMGIHDSQVGKRSNETSGKGILARQQQGERGTFIYQDNFAESLKTLGTILLDMIPRIYDADRVVRILGIDGEVRKVKFGARPEEDYNHEELKPEERIYDPKVGLYDVVVTVGPSHATRRTEAVEGMTQFVEAAPDLAPIIFPRVAKLLDFPDADELAEDLETLLPPAIQEKHREKRGEGEKVGASGLLGPDGQPIDPASLEQEAPGGPEGEQPVEDPTMQAKVAKAEAEAVKAQANAAIAVLELRAKAKEQGLSDKAADALVLKMQEGQAGGEPA